MQDPIRLVTDIFEDKNLSYASLRSFSEEFLIRLASPVLNPGGIYNTLLVDTSSRYTAYFGTVEDKLVKSAVQKGLTLSMNQAYGRLIEQLRRMRGLVQFKFGEGTDQYEGFFPQGMDEYNQASIGQLPELLERFLSAANTYLLADYPTDVDNFVTAKNQFTNARTAQETMFSSLKTTRTGRHERRKELTLQLTKCFLIIAADHIENPDRFDDYYSLRYLPIRRKKK
ncbi:MAG: hypothetical protein IPP77_14910 [Bacteroidetes bacterium]|nr:hypothetical protein [Bacteroidota bacterium]